MKMSHHMFSKEERENYAFWHSFLAKRKMHTNKKYVHSLLLGPRCVLNYLIVKKRSWWRGSGSFPSLTRTPRTSSTLLHSVCGTWQTDKTSQPWGFSATQTKVNDNVHIMSEKVGVQKPCYFCGLKCLYTYVWYKPHLLIQIIRTGLGR